MIKDHVSFTEWFSAICWIQNTLGPMCDYDEEKGHTISIKLMC